ncbi:alpha/beta hydrolase family protein [Antricoccus suffuscus]|uniref:Alpha/beta hydrolase family protein n=1 Tax=Antricoccus suffuscus TaxID=1629062 RepID=A0A2T0ZCK7_9ACTN|nr:alpha/beta hydrolase [Antricoccus suffuscus]PRZ33878.1 alpha/beta hydrolase family protein [Antricoccus suffuscus]
MSTPYRRRGVYLLITALVAILALSGCGRVVVLDGTAAPRYPQPDAPDVAKLPDLPAYKNTLTWSEFKDGVAKAISTGVKNGAVTDHSRIDQIVYKLADADHDDPGVQVVMATVLSMAKTQSKAPAQIAESGRSAEDGALAWAPCGDDGLECASLKVPLDYDNPGDTIEIKLDRYKAKDPDKRIGVLLGNPGGPGGSGIDFLPAWYGGLSDEIKDSFDVVSFDPRGVGQSDPFYCGPVSGSSDVNPDPKTKAEEDAYTEQAGKFADACAKAGKDMLKHMGTKDVARDVEKIRTAMGEDQISYVGYSYGTAIGQTYANMFPGKVRAFVLDGVMNTAVTKQQLSSAQTAAFDKALRRFSGSCEKVCTGLAQYLTTKLQDDNIESKYLSSSDYVDQTYLNIGISAALYSAKRWPYLAWALREAAADSDGTLLALSVDDYTGRSIFSGEYTSNGDDSFSAVMCRDFATSSLDDAYAMSRSDNRLHPVFANRPDVICNEWPVPPDPLGALTWPKGTPVLLVSTTGDPATPHEMGKSVAARNPSAVLLTHDGDGHTAYSNGDSCIDDKVNKFLLDVKAPKKGTVCK